MKKVKKGYTLLFGRNIDESGNITGQGVKVCNFSLHKGWWNGKQFFGVELKLLSGKPITIELVYPTGRTTFAGGPRQHTTYGVWEMPFKETGGSLVYTTEFGIAPTEIEVKGK